MRIDKVEHRKIPIGRFQIMVNNLVKVGKTQQEIEGILADTKTQIGQYSEEPVLLYFEVILEPSHLRKGYICSFLCPTCVRKTKALYYLNKILDCRICHNLTYKKQTRRDAIIKRLVRNPELADQYMSSNRRSYWWMVAEAEAAREEIQRRGYEIADGLIMRKR